MLMGKAQYNLNKNNLKNDLGDAYCDRFSEIWLIIAPRENQAINSIRNIG